MTEKSDAHSKEAREEEHDADRRDVDVLFAYPAIAHDSGWEEDHEYARR